MLRDQANPLVLVEDANGTLVETIAPNSRRKVCATPHCSQPCFHLGLCNPPPGAPYEAGRSSRRKVYAAQLELVIAASLKARRVYNSPCVNQIVKGKTIKLSILRLSL